MLGASGRAMLAELCQGNNDPNALAELAKGKLRAKLPALRQALEGRFSSHHALLVSHLLAHVDYLDETIGSLSSEIEERAAPFRGGLELLQTIPAVGPITAEVMLAEFGPDMGRFPAIATPPAGRRSAPVTTSRPASAARARRATATAGFAQRLIEAANSALAALAAPI